MEKSDIKKEQSLCILRNGLLDRNRDTILDLNVRSAYNKGKRWDIPHIGPVMKLLKEYNVHLDSKNRITIRGALFDYYNVKEYENGCLLLEPRELIAPESLSADTLKEMDESIRNFKNGLVSEPIDLSDFE